MTTIRLLIEHRDYFNLSITFNIKVLYVLTKEVKLTAYEKYWCRNFSISTYTSLSLSMQTWKILNLGNI